MLVSGATSMSSTIGLFQHLYSPAGYLLFNIRIYRELPTFMQKTRHFGSFEQYGLSILGNVKSRAVGIQARHRCRYEIILMTAGVRAVFEDVSAKLTPAPASLPEECQPPMLVLIPLRTPRVSLFFPVPPHLLATSTTSLCLDIQRGTGF